MKYLDVIDWLCGLLVEMQVGSTLTVPSKYGMAVVTCLSHMEGKMFTVDVGDYHFRHKSIFHTARRVAY